MQTVADLLEQLTIANLKTWKLKDEQAEAVRAIDPRHPTSYYMKLVERDIVLCKVRASLRAEINERLGDKTADATITKSYGTERTKA